MTIDQGTDWEPPARAGFTSDDGRHRRNLRSLSNFLRSPHIGNAQIQNASIEEAHIQDLAVTDAKIKNLTVSKLTTGTLAADVILSGKISTADEGQRVEIDINGIRLIDGSEHETVTIPVVGEARFEGSIVASGLHVTDDASFAGMVALELGSETTLASSVSGPVSAPGLAQVYPIEPLGAGLTDRRGLSYDSGDDRWIAVGPSSDQVQAYDRGSGGDVAWTLTPRSTASSGGRPAVFGYNVSGAVRVGLNLWVTGRWLFNSKKYLLRYQLSSGVPTDSAPTSRTNLEPVIGADDNLLGITYNGADLLLMFKNPSDALRVARYSTAAVHEATTTIETGFTGTARSLTFHTDSGANWWVVADDLARGYTAAGARVASADFPLPPDSAGLAHDGSAFYSLPASASYVNQHSDWISTQSWIHVRYTYFLAAGSKESLGSPVSILGTRDRSFLRVSLPGIPTGADGLRVYALENNVATDPAAGASKLQGTLSVPQTDLDIYNGAGAADPTVSTFTAAGTPATLMTQDAGFELRGDGYMVLPKFTGDPTGVEGRIYMNTTTHKARVHNGSTWNDLF